jgi:sporulation protein YlmC with PRC-barrel domain
MLRSVSDLRRFTIATTDGNLGQVGDVYFDDRSWAVRYLAVDAGTWLPGRRVLISPVSVRNSDPTTFHIALSTQQVTTSPDGTIIRVVPVSPAAQGGVERGTMARGGEGSDGHLQTATAVLGYAVQAEDGEIGHVKDVLVDDKAWAIRYLVVDTQEWWSGKRVLVSPEWLARVAWDESRTLICIATAVDDNIGSARAAAPSNGHWHAVAPRSSSSSAPGRARA